MIGEFAESNEIALFNAIQNEQKAERKEKSLKLPKNQLLLTISYYVFGRFR